MVVAESAPRDVLDGQEAPWGTAVAAVGASGEPVPPSEGTINVEAEAVSAAGKTLRSLDGDRR